jgi:hypothetical protein
MTDDDNSIADPKELTLRQERVVRGVLARIAAAPRVSPVARTGSTDLIAWTVPVLAAASVIMIVSGRTLLTTSREDPANRTVIEWLGLPPLVAEYLETGTVTPSLWLNAYGNGP